MLAGLDEAGREATWQEIEQELGAFEGKADSHFYLRDHARAKGPNRIPAARTANADSHAEAT